MAENIKYASNKFNAQKYSSTLIHSSKSASAVLRSFLANINRVNK